MTSIGFIGCGNMGGAIASALCKKEDYQVLVYDAFIEKAQDFANQNPTVIVCKDLKETFEKSTIIVLAVKPQILQTLYQKLRVAGTEGKKIISIAAGVPLCVLERELGSSSIVRFMPNLAAKVEKAVTAIACKDNLDAEFKNQAFEIAKSFGSAFFLDEKLFPAFIGISGSAIAYVFEFMHALSLGGVKEGIAYPMALDIARDTMLSAIALQKESGKNPVELETAVCSAAGTTIDGVCALKEGKFEYSVIDAVVKASEKSKIMEEKASK